MVVVTIDDNELVDDEELLAMVVVVVVMLPISIPLVEVMVLFVDMVAVVPASVVVADVESAAAVVTVGPSPPTSIVEPGKDELLVAFGVVLFEVE